VRIVDPTGHEEPCCQVTTWMNDEPKSTGEPGWEISEIALKIPSSPGPPGIVIWLPW